ncbi:MAG TPA: SRPBCC family protein [Caulobacteraceae bacterium]|nr:SRPBCC family protein [Caulobacteraceae bacterium]
MAESQFLYVAYIRAPAEKVWAALADPEQNKLFWGGFHQESVWRVGADYAIRGPDGRTRDSGEVLEFDPPRRLAVSWLHRVDEAMRAEGHSIATFDLEGAGEGVTKLTLTHTAPVAASKLIGAVASGWPMILSSLKSLLETGAALG